MVKGCGVNEATFRFFERSHENVGIGGSHECTHGCVLYLQIVFVVEEEVVVFEDKVEQGSEKLQGWSWCVGWKCGKCLDCCLYSFVVWDVVVKGCDVNCDKDGVGWQWCWYLENGVEEMGSVFDIGGDEGNQGFEVVFNVFGEIVGGAVTA